MIIRRATPNDYPQIVRLQTENSLAQLSPTERLQGFIVSSMTPAQLADINAALGILLAVEGETVVGFICMMPTDTHPRPPVVDAMLAEMKQQSLHGTPLTQLRVFLYGPVCLDRRWRGRGLLRQLFTAVKDFTRHDYDIGAAFINLDNPHSLAAHVAGLGMTVISQFSCLTQHYQLVVFTTESADRE